MISAPSGSAVSVLLRRPGARGRSQLFAVSVVSGSVAVTTVLVRGLLWVNLDSLYEEPGSFYALVVLPAVLATVCLVGALLPRTLRINLAVFVCLLVLAETAVWALRPAGPAIHGEPEAVGAPTFYAPDPALGYVLTPSVTARHRRMENGKLAYDVTYRIDDRGRRLTPAALDAPWDSFLLFFGDSNTFGEGLGQTETLPYYAGQLAPRYRPYNYGVPGYGPSQLLVLAGQHRVGNEVTGRAGYAAFFLIPAHVGRVVGSSKVSTGWGRHFTYYALGERGAPASRGDFVHGRPFTTLAYFFWTKSNLADYFGVDLPVRYTPDDYRLTARILAESGRQLERQLELRGFVVILGQVFNEAQSRVIHAVQDALAREGVTVVDYTRLFDASDPQYHLSALDYHNSAKANRAMAARLVADLGIGEVSRP